MTVILPPRIGKSNYALNMLAFLRAKFPDKKVGYSSYEEGTIYDEMPYDKIEKRIKEVLDRRKR